MIRSKFAKLAGMLLLACLSAPAALADEGMWTFDNPPVKQLQEKFGFTPDAAWLEHLRLASVRVGDGGSGSFVSPEGLVLTNHHVGRGQIQKLSSAGNDYIANGFYARTPAEELKCPDMEINILVSLENITGRIQSPVKPGMTEKEALDARKAAIALAEKESQQATGLRSDVVSMYSGGEYWLYRYKRYTDVRLVFAPEMQIAFFGGDPDNFTYPRHDIDMTIFRVWENNQPLKTPHYLQWNAKGAEDGELVFVSGHPGRTNRLMTLTQLQSQRDVEMPERIKGLRRQLDVLRRYAARGPEQQRQATGSIFGLENSLKSSLGEYNGLKNPELMAVKEKEEQDFRARVAANPEWQKAYGSSWEAVAASLKKYQERRVELQNRSFSAVRLVGTALSLVQLAAELPKPDGERLDGYHDSQLQSLKFRLLSPAPVYPEMQEAMLAASLQWSLEALGPQDPFIKMALAGRTPEEAARQIMSGTKMADPSFRRGLLEGGQAAVQACTDPLIVLARQFDPMSREMKKWEEDQVKSMQSAAAEKIGKARLAVYGKSVHPDANFTLRLSYGTVCGYPANGTIMPPFTTFFGLYDRHAGFGGQPPFHLPARFTEQAGKVDLATRLNFVCSCDIIGGNSGSPVVNRRGELVGLVFDGNIESLVGRFIFDISSNRTVSVHSAAMLHALRVFYGAGPLADELEGKR